MEDTRNDFQNSQDANQSVAQNDKKLNANSLPVVLVVLVLVAGALYFFYKEYYSFVSSDDMASYQVILKNNVAPENRINDKKADDIVNAVEYEIDLTDLDNLDQELDILNNI